jgi:hypothetical protein
VQEICVKRVDLLRYAAEQGHYNDVFNGLNGAMSGTRS